MQNDYVSRLMNYVNTPRQLLTLTAVMAGLVGGGGVHAGYNESQTAMTIHGKEYACDANRFNIPTEGFTPLWPLAVTINTGSELYRKMNCDK